MKKEMMSQVTDSIFEVMETMFFMTLEKQKREIQNPSEELISSAIKFSGAFSGTIYLEIPRRLLEAMTENFMGQDIDRLSDDYIWGTLKEALNMVAGSALTKVDATVYMGLGIPEIVPSPPAREIDETAVLATSQGNILAHVKLD